MAPTGLRGGPKLLCSTNNQASTVSTMEISKVAEKWKRAISEETISQHGRDCGMTKRMRTVTPFRLACVLIDAFATHNVETIADIERHFIAMTGKSLEYKLFYKQLAKSSFAEFMRLVLCNMLGHLVLDVLRPKPGSALSKFDDILLHDGSSLSVAKALAEHYPGRFTNHSPAAVELHATMSLPRDAVVSISLTPDTTGERAQLPDPLTLVNKLLIADRGYEDRSWFAGVIAAGGSFLVRCKAKANPFVEQCWIDGGVVRGFSGKNLKEFMNKLRGQSADRGCAAVIRGAMCATAWC